MHQIFYIGIDEEISSVIDRLKKSMAKDNYFVVPKRALFMQSIVNLKLLKREAEKDNKQVIIITQDQVAASMAQKAGISTRSSMDGLESVSDLYTDNVKKMEINPENSSPSETDSDLRIVQDKQSRLKNIGSDDFFDASSNMQEKEPMIIKSEPKKIPVRSTSYSPIFSSPNKSVKRTDFESPLRQETYRSNSYRKTLSQDSLQNKRTEFKYDIFRKKDSNMGGIDPYKEKTLEKIFSSSPNEQKKPAVQEVKKIGKKSKKIFFGFVLFCLFVLSGVAIYLFVPNAVITIIPAISENKKDINIQGSVSAQVDAGNIPIRIIDKNEEISLSYDVTGKSEASGKKAHGSVVIYNEYSSSPQTLVATTRLESEDGKIFRIVKNIVVPGTTEISGSVQPGAIEVEVIADQPGSEYNIDKTKFTIPGFSGGPKFDKFYAKSSNSMTGGSSDDDKPSAVSQQDIDNAKIKTENAIKEKINGIILAELQLGEVVLPQAEKITVIKSSTGAKAGDAVTSFDYNAQASVRAIVFSENDIRKIVQQSIEQAQGYKKEISKIEYNNVEADFDNSTLKLKALGEIKNIPNIDTEKIKEEVLGKSADQVGDILKKYPSIKNANIELWPSFISHISPYSKRVNVQISAEK